MTSDFDFQEGTPLATLLKQGWIVASTSYRRNGWIVGEAVEDIEILRKKVIEEHGAPSMTLVVGTSMGGVIATIIAEKGDPRNYQGVLAIAAALGGDPAALGKLNHNPQIPLLFLSNQNEAINPHAYVLASAKATCVPVLWTVRRDGHANLTQAEYAEGVHALIKFCETGKIESTKDATIADPIPVSTAIIHAKNALVTVTSVDAVYGNISTDMVVSDLSQIGLKKGDSLLIAFKKTNVSGHWVTAYSDVPKGEWLAFVTAEGRVEIARNLANAAQTLGVKAGDKIDVSPIQM